MLFLNTEIELCCQDFLLLFARWFTMGLWLFPGYFTDIVLAYDYEIGNHVPFHNQLSHISVEYTKRYSHERLNRSRVNPLNTELLRLVHKYGVLNYKILCIEKIPSDICQESTL